MISTPSYPAFLASRAERAKSFTTCSTRLDDIALALNGVIGDFVALADSENGV